MGTNKKKLDFENKDYYIGLDIGTNSVGWTVTDKDYYLIKRKKKYLHGIRLFESTNQAKDRRTKRANRRRLRRRKERLNLLENIFSKEILEKDASFFVRLRESKLHIEDKSIGVKYPLFISKEYSDVDYHAEFPTIYHLRKELIEKPEKVYSDHKEEFSRLVFLALHHIIKYRGHFLTEGKLGELTNFDIAFNRAFDILNSEEFCEGTLKPFTKQEKEKFKEILVDKSLSKSKKQEKLAELFDFDEEEVEKKYRDREEDCDSSLERKDIKKNDLVKKKKNVIKAFCKYIAGVKGSIADLISKSKDDIIELTEEEELTKSFTLGEKNYESKIYGMIENLLSEYKKVFDSAKELYDFGLLENILNGENYLSSGMVKSYEEHQINLKIVKALLSEYDNKTKGNKSEYDKLFRYSNFKTSYPSYTGHYDRGEVLKEISKIKSSDIKRCTGEDFYKNLEEVLKKVKDEDIWNEDFEKNNLTKVKEDLRREKRILVNDFKFKNIDELIRATSNETSEELFPMQRTGANGVIPRQVHERELEKILENASKYLEFLNEKDENGLDDREKILAIFRHKIPYFIGPLSNRHKNEGANTWMVRKEGKEEGRIYPWNFKEMVDFGKSGENFIRRMTNKCTYLKEEDVIPKNSLMYQKYMVLNELNNVRVRGKKLTVEEKQDIFNEVFKEKSKVTGKKLLKYLKKSDIDLKLEDLSGFDKDFNSSLNSYIDFHNIKIDLDSERNRKMVEEIIFWKTIYGESYEGHEIIDNNIEKKYKGFLTEEQIKKIRSLKYKDFGNFSEKFLNEITSDDGKGQKFTILEALYNTNDNLMQLLSSDYNFSEEIEKLNGNEEERSYEDIIADMYISPANKRSVLQSVQIVDEIIKVMGREPKKIFVEMARGEEEKKRTNLRSKQLDNLYSEIKKNLKDFESFGITKGEVSNLQSIIEQKKDKDDRYFKSKKIYLYFLQLGKDMYTGEPIDLDVLIQNNFKYDIDHIYPQSKTKDDSFNNLVLTNKKSNASEKKADRVPREVQDKMKNFWAMLYKNGLITKVKYERLTRRGEFSEEELQGFIARQLVETRQASKAVAKLFEKLYEKPKVVYVKANLVSDFRKEPLGIFKSRRVNDYHHADDAYLNIVVGDLYNTKFTDDPYKWIRDNKHNILAENSKNDIKGIDGNGKQSEKRRQYYRLNKIYKWPIYTRDGEEIWDGLEKYKDIDGKWKFKEPYRGEVLDRVRGELSKGGYFYTEYTYCEKGVLFDEQPCSKYDEGTTVELKKGLEKGKYGGYKKAKTSYFAFIEYDLADKKGKLKHHKQIVGVPIMVANKLKHNKNALIEYFEAKGFKNIKMIKDKIKKNSLITVDGYPMRLRGENENKNLLKGNLQLKVDDKTFENLRRVEKVILKNQKGNYIVEEEYDKINNQILDGLYDTLLDKMKGPYKNRPASQVKNLESVRETFIKSENLLEKCKVIDNMLQLLRCDIRTSADLSYVDKGSRAGECSMSKNTLGKSKIKLINQSVTGIFENKVEL